MFQVEAQEQSIAVPADRKGDTGHLTLCVACPKILDSREFYVRNNVHGHLPQTHKMEIGTLTCNSMIYGV